MNLFERIGQIVVISSLLSSVYMIFTMAEASSEGESEIFGGRFRMQARAAPLMETMTPTPKDNTFIW